MCLNPLSVKKHYSKHYMYVSCGKCPECKKYEANLWNNRLLLERPKWQRSFLITLTINPYNYDYFQHKRNYKRYLQLMFKRIRKFGVNFRYFLVAESGSLNFRLHCHMIYFTNWVNIIQVWKLFKHFYRLGFINIKPCNNGAYRYLMKYLEKGSLFRLISKGIGYLPDNVLYSYILSNRFCHKYYYDKFRKIFGDEELFKLKLLRDNDELKRLFLRKSWKDDRNNPANIKTRKELITWRLRYMK